MGKRICLTGEGEAFLHYVNVGLNAFDKARKSIEEFKEWGVPRLRLGAGAAISRLLLPPVMADMRRLHPRFILNAVIVRPADIIGSLERGELDLALGQPPQKMPQIEFIHLFDSLLRVVFCPSHPWAGRGKMSNDDLAKEPCLLINSSHPTRRSIDRYFAQERIQLNRVAEIESFDAIKALVLQGFGISILPDWVVKSELAAGTLSSLLPGRRRLAQSWGLLRWRGHSVSPVENNFRQCCVAAAKMM